MNRRGIVGAVAMALLLLLFLFVLYRTGVIGMTGGVLLVAAGIACVGASHHFHCRMWSDDEPPNAEATNPEPDATS
jgi:hypothetical protein